MSRRILLLSLFFLTAAFAEAQNTLRRSNDTMVTGGNDRYGDDEEGKGRFTMNSRDEEEEEEEPIPIGQFQWVVDPRLGTIIPAENNDTIVHNYQNFCYTDGMNGQYNYLGNLGSPRLSRIYLQRPQFENFLYLSTLSYFRQGLQDFRFTNTKSPITNLAYHSSGGPNDGEDHIRAYFATNIKKNAGLGFKLDYAYGRGEYNSCATSLFGVTFYGYYLGDRYNAHAYININHMKMAENGGIEKDIYITDPQSFPSSYTSGSIPVVLDRTWNRNHEQNYYLSHRFNLGYYREMELPDSLKPIMPSDDELMSSLTDSVRTLISTDSVQRIHIIDSLHQRWQSQQIIPKEFIPVSSLVHTLDVRLLDHTYIAKDTPSDYYTNHYYGAFNNVNDDTHAMSVRNTVGLSMREGFRRWVKFGLTAFATHQLRTYRLLNPLPDTVAHVKTTESDLSVGGELLSQKGKFVNYRATAEFWLMGGKVGDFDADGRADLKVRLGRFDSLQVDVHARIAREQPGYYFRHHHSQFTWWDNDDLSHELRTRVEGNIRLTRLGTRLNVGFENITNYTYFAMQRTLKPGKSATSTITGDYLHDVTVRQYDGSIQVFNASIAQDLKLFGPLHWDNEVTYQACSNKDVLPLPTVTLYSNLYVLFRIAKVLRCQWGADLRFFTNYYAPDYAPSIQQFAVQDPSVGRVKIGTYPIVNVYLNFHLKHCRFYVAMSHVNSGEGRYFLAPHYPINPRSFRFGLSWNFFN